jgi:LmbE family N-acetylglucosaminyl deacetylase
METSVALARVTHLGIGAHHDDLEFMAFHGIAACHAHEAGRWFGGVVCTDGAGSARSGDYARLTPAELRGMRQAEQREAARRGHYAAMVQLDHPSAAARVPGAPDLVPDLVAILRATRPEVVYTHNLADKHDTHLGVVAAALTALRALPPEERPGRVLGCEVWRGLDWVSDGEKLALDVSGHDALASELNRVFESQIAGGKRYDCAVLGRRAANATFADPHTTDRASQVILAMDLTPLAHDASLDPVAYALGYVDRFRESVRSALAPHFAGLT